MQSLICLLKRRSSEMSSVQFVCMLALVYLLISTASAVPVIDESAKTVGKNSSLPTTTRVINGQPVTSPREFPFVVDLVKDRDHISSSRFCTGTLIRPNVVLTAAHCALGSSGGSSGTYAAVGRINVKDGHEDNANTTTFRSTAALVHPSYTGIGSEYDVALLLLDGKSAAPTVRLAATTPTEDQEAWVVGYGIQKIGTLESVAQPIQVMSGRLQKTALRIKERSFCDHGESALRTREGMLCTTGVKEGSTACMGDSGGGLIVSSNSDHGSNNASREDSPKVQVGVVSYGDSSCMSEDSGVFTDVASVRNWIDEGTKRLQAVFEPAQISLTDRTVHKILHRGSTAGFHGITFDKNIRRGLKYYHIQTAFTVPHRVTVSLCGSPQDQKTHLFMMAGENTERVMSNSGSCPEGKLSVMTFKMFHDDHVVGVAGEGDSVYNLSVKSEASIEAE